MTISARHAGGASAGSKGRTTSGAAMIVGTSLSIQLAGALAHGLFEELGPAGTSALRFALGAVILLVVVRPRLCGRDRGTWGAIVAYGVALAALNLTFFAAIERVPMGIAMTFGFIAPLAMALARSRRRLDIVFGLIAAAGVVTLGGLDRPDSISGLLFSLASGCAWVGVAYAGKSVGSRTRRIDGLALAVPIAALVTLPFGLAHAGALDGHALVLGLVIAVGGLIVPFALELEGLRRLEPRTVAVIYSIDPAVAALVGLVVLGESPSAAQVLGMAAVIVASAGATAGARGAPLKGTQAQQDLREGGI